VLSIANRISGVVLSIGAVGLVLWLVAAANGPGSYAYVQWVLASTVGQVALLLFVFAFLFHLCGGIRHLVWDAGFGFELATIYVSGWSLVAASVALTVAVWAIAKLLVQQ
jgi:succinate dehydrogenase / fumarate reductase cytochrome b subunit